MKKSGLIQKKDIILLMILLAVSIVLVLWLLFSKKQGNKIIVEQNGTVIYELSLENEGTYFVQDGEFINELVIKDGEAFMSHANCKDLICVNHRPISKVNETITCLPHKLVVYVVGDTISEVDAVVN